MFEITCKVCSESVNQKEMETHAEKCEFQPKLLAAYTTEEKIKFFDQVYATALEDYYHVQKFARPTKGTAHYCWERTMELLGPGIWDIYKKLVS